MGQEAYELIALTARYFFAGMMLAIVLRAGWLTLVDSRRAAKLRRLSPLTGLSGELIVLEGDERARRGMRYPIIREGAIGASRRSDVRIRHSSVRRRHAYFQLTDRGLYVRSHAGSRLYDYDDRTVREMLLADGDTLRIGRIRLLLVLSEVTAQQTSQRQLEEGLFMTRISPERRQVLRELHGDDLFETWEEQPDRRDFLRPPRQPEPSRPRDFEAWADIKAFPRPTPPREYPEYRAQGYNLQHAPQRTPDYARPLPPRRTPDYARRPAPEQNPERPRRPRPPRPSADGRVSVRPVRPAPPPEALFDVDDPEF